MERERPPVLEGGLAGQVSRGARSAADHFDPRPHQSSPNHTPLISTRRGTKAVHVLHVMHVTARAHAPLSLSLSLSPSVRLWFARHPASAAFSSYAHSNPPLIIPLFTLPFRHAVDHACSLSGYEQNLVTVAHRSRSMFGNIGRIIEIVDRTLYIANDIDSFQRGSVHVFFLSLKSWFTSCCVDGKGG